MRETLYVFLFFSCMQLLLLSLLMLLREKKSAWRQRCYELKQLDDILTVSGRLSLKVVYVGRKDG